MRRQLQRLYNQTFDVVVVGGGVYGATIAYTAVCKGYSVALIEKGDFNCGTSANSLKILHGGLRYLQHLNIGRIRRSILSRNFFLRHFPHLIDNTNFLMPLRGHGMKGPLVMGTGLLINDLISLDRNRNLTQSSRIGRSKILSPRQTASLAPGVDLEGCTGGALWVESVINDTERLVLELTKRAVAQRAEVANYVTATALLQTAGRVTGLACRDFIGGEEGNIYTSVVIDATGPAVGALGQTLSHYQVAPRHHVRAVNMIFKRRLFGQTAVGLPCRDSVRDNASFARSGKRMLFFVPWKEYTMVGTFYDLEENTERGLLLSTEEKAGYLDAVQALLPNHAVRADDVCRWHIGWLPLAENALPGEIDLAKTSSVRSLCSGDQPVGLIEVTAAKFTTAPVVAEQTVDVLTTICAPSSAARDCLESQPDSAPVRARPLENHLRRRYGADWSQVHTIIQEAQETSRIVAGDTTAAEILYAVRSEMACSLADVVIRRTSMADCGLPPEPELRAVAKLMGTDLGWDSKKIDEEILQLLRTGYLQDGGV